MRKREKGFTLIELSIVLVIIGLLIGGILVAQSMVETAKISAVVKQLQQYDIAVSNFKLKFNYLPGDAPQFGGDGDGYITCCANPGSPNDNYFQYEIANFWASLSLSENINNGKTYVNGWNLVVGTNFPKLNIGSSYTGIIALSPSQAQTGLYGIPIYLITGFPNADTLPQHQYWLCPPNLAHAISAADALSIDLKIDDGLANAGNVQAAGDGSVQYLWQNIDSTPGSGCVLSADPSKYNASSTSPYPCSLSVRIGASTGQAQ